MTGRWTIRRRNGGIDGNDALLDDTAARSADDWMPVVPSDDETVERIWPLIAARHEFSGDYAFEIVNDVLRLAGGLDDA